MRSEVPKAKIVCFMCCKFRLGHLGEFNHQPRLKRHIAWEMAYESPCDRSFLSQTSATLIEQNNQERSSNSRLLRPTTMT